MTPEPSTIMINDQLSSSSNASSATASPSTPLSSTTVTTATASMNDNNNNNNHSNNHEPWISTISTSMANYHPQQQLSNHLRSQLTNNSGYSSSSPPRQPPPSTLSLMNKSLNDQEKGFNKDNSPATSSMTEMLQQALTISTICNYRQRFERLLLLIIFIVCTLCIILLVLMIVILINQRYLNEKTINNDNNNQNNEQNYWKQLQSSLSSYPHPQLLPGYYHYYYSINNGINHPLNVPLLMANNDQNQSSSSSSLSESNTNNDNHTMIEQPKQSSMNQNPLKFYQNFIPTPPMGPIFSALQLLSARNSNNNANDDYYKRIAAMINKQPEQLKSTFISPDYTNQDSRTVCLSSGCVKAASDILNLIDETIDPCDDFYRFACGGWIHRTTIPDEAGHISIFEQSRERLDIQLKDLLERTNELTSTPPIRTMKNLYRSCMNLTAIEKIGTKSLRNSLNELGGWPVVVGDQWNENEFDWINVTGKIRRIGYKPEMFVTFKVIADVMNNTRNMIFIDEATLGLRRQLITQGSNHTTVRVYHQLMVDTAILFGAQNRTKVEQEMWDVIAFESQIAHATHDPSQGEKKQSWYLYLKAFADVANQSEVLATNQSRLGHDWIRFINAAIELPDDEKFNEKELVMVDNIRYMGQIDYLISFVNKHDKRLLANYMLWRVVLQNLGTGSKVMRDMRDNLNKHLYGITEKMARWKLCLSQLTGSLAIALSSHYIRYNFNETSKEKAKEMVKFIQQEFEDILHHTDWMDNETKINAFKKSSAMKAIVGYPHELANETLVEEHYKDLHLTPDNFELNIRRVRIWAHRNEFKKLRKRNDPHNWKYFGNAANVNAFYWSQANSIVIPAGILRDIFYDHDRPQYLNFGTIGYVIGHEITHGFDNIGAQFDEIGNARNWWRNDTKKHYHEKAQCMVKQYREYPLKVNKLQINGELTLKENIADNGAIKEAYQAYERYVKKFGEELLLPGLRYTPRQLFWIAAAMNWCSKSSPEMFKTRLDTDSHSPSEARVNVAFSNYQPFADTFGCRLGTKSNALHKCSVW